jgi:mRNA interferase MazF
MSRTATGQRKEWLNPTAHDVEPNGRNGLRVACRLMVDKITTVRKTKVGARIGRLNDEDILRLNQAVLTFLGLAVSPRARQQP